MKKMVYDWEEENDFETVADDDTFNLLSLAGLATALVIIIGTFLGWI